MSVLDNIEREKLLPPLLLLDSTEGPAGCPEDATGHVECLEVSIGFK